MLPHLQRHTSQCRQNAGDFTAGVLELSTKQSSERPGSSAFVSLLALIVSVLCGCDPQESYVQSSAATDRIIPKITTTFDSSPISPIDIEPDLSDSRVQIGKKLFHDTRLSGDNTISCASCHEIRSGGDDGREVAVGIRGAVGTVNTPTVLNSGLNFAQFWDGRATTLEAQVLGPIKNRLEMDSNLEDILQRLGADAEVVASFRGAYDEGLTSKNIIDAISAYERALVTPGAPFDRFLNGEVGALSAVAQQGYKDFRRFGCVSCHQGRNIGGNMFQRFGVMGNYFEDRGNITTADFGRFNATGNEEDKFKFKVPSLRNIAETAPYFHDGSAPTLEAAIRTMAKYQLGRSLGEVQVANIEAFLNSLTGQLDATLYE